MKKLGLFSQEQLQTADALFSHPDTIYSILMDREALWNPASIDTITNEFPHGHFATGDLFLVLAECIANAVLHGQAKALGFYARKRAGLLLLSFYQMPIMQPRILSVLKLAREGKIKECAEDLPGGLGFPILMRLVHRITVSNDLSRLQLWVRAPKS